jgi:hypothetical protein
VFVEGAQVRVVADGDQGGHVEGPSEVLVAGFRNARLLLDGGPGGVLAGIEARLRDGELRL